MSDQKGFIFLLKNETLPGVFYLGQTAMSPEKYCENINAKGAGGFEIEFSIHVAQAKIILSEIQRTLTERGGRVEGKDLLYRTSSKEVCDLVADLEGSLKAEVSLLSKEEMSLNREPTISDENAQPKPKVALADLMPVEYEKYLDILNCAVHDLYIQLPSNDRFIVYVASGFEFNDQKREKLKKHSNPLIFIKKSDLENLSETSINTEIGMVDSVTEGVRQKITGMHKNLLSKEPQDPVQLLKEVTEVSEAVISEIIPNTYDIKKLIQETFTDPDLENDVKALTSISLMLGLASKFNSQQTFLDITMACSLMDLSIANLGPHVLNLYYTRALDDYSTLKEKFKSHPVQSDMILTMKMPHLNSTVRDIILTHHERIDGSGYPRGLKESKIMPLAQVVCLAVDIFEELKYHSHMGLKTSVAIILNKILEDQENGGPKRHSSKLIKDIVKYTTPESKAA